MAQNRILYWPNQKLRELQNDLLSYANSIERWKASLEENKRNLKEYSELLDSYQDAINVLVKYKDMRTFSLEAPIEKLDSMLELYEGRISSLKNNIIRADKQISDYTAFRLKAEFEIKSLRNGPVKIDVKTFRKQLRSDRVKAVRFKTIFVNEQEQFRGISVTLNPGTATVRNTGYPIDPVISIPACTINITSPGHRLKITSKNGEGIRGYSSQPVAHPHILSRQEPCLGDFGGPFWEAIDDQDLVSALSILLLFLETVDSNDAAGSYWSYWPWLNKNELVMQCDHCNKLVDLHNPYTHRSNCEYHPGYVSTDELVEALEDFNDEAQAADDMYLSRID